MLRMEITIGVEIDTEDPGEAREFSDRLEHSLSTLATSDSVSGIGGKRVDVRAWEVSRPSILPVESVR